MKNQKGFTLVEMAIVLVIIGLLLGGVLKGQELIESSRIKNAANDINGVIAAYNGYVDRFRAVPGDDNGGVATGNTGLTDRGTAWTAAVAGNANGQLVDATPFGSDGENLQFWVHTRAAGFVAGSPATTGAAALPNNAFSGLIGVTSSALGGTTVIPAGTAKVCLSNVPGKAARSLDVAMDDGNALTGIMRGYVAAAGATGPTSETPPNATTANAYNDDNVFTVCRTM